MSVWVLTNGLLLRCRVADVADDAARLFYPVVEGDRGEALIYSSGVDDLLTPVELSGWLLRHLTQRAERHLRESVTGAVITVPAHFNDRQKDATLAAAAQAGLRQVHLLQGGRLHWQSCTSAGCSSHT